MKNSLFLITMFLANIVLAQTLKFNAYDALKEQSVIDIQESYKLDSITYIVDARKEVATRAMPKQYLVEINSETNNYSVTELDQVSAVFYNTTKKSYTKTDGVIYRLRVDESNGSLKLHMDQLVNKKFQESDKPFYTESLTNIKTGSLEINNYLEGFDFQILNEEGGLSGLHIFSFNRSDLKLSRKESVFSKPGQESIWFKQVKYGRDKLIVSYTCKQNDKRIDVTVQIFNGKRTEYIFDDYSGDKVWAVTSTVINHEQYVIKTFKSKDSDNLSIAIFRLDENKGVFEKLDEAILQNSVLVNDYFADHNSKQANTYIKNNYKLNLKKTYYYDHVVNGNDIYLFFNTEFNGSFTDFVILKITNNKIGWTQKIRRGYVTSRNDILSKSPTPMTTFPKVELVDDELKINMIDRDFFYDEKGNYIPNLEDKLAVLNYNVIPVTIYVKLEDGTFIRELDNK